MNRDDSQLVLLAIQGDRTAFGELIRRHQERLYHTVYRLLGHPDDAQDVVQDAFISAYQSLRHFKGDARFSTWLYRIAVNSAISKKRKRRIIVQADLPPHQRIVEPLDESFESQPGDALEREEDEEALQDALNQLTPEHRTVLVLKEIDGERYETIAEILKIPVGTVRSRLHRARLELNDLLIAKEARREQVESRSENRS